MRRIGGKGSTARLYACIGKVKGQKKAQLALRLCGSVVLTACAQKEEEETGRGNFKSGNPDITTLERLVAEKSALLLCNIKLSAFAIKLFILMQCIKINNGNHVAANARPKLALNAK